MLRVIICILSLAIVSITMQASAIAADQNIKDDDSWHFSVAPYLWAINMNGTNQIGQRRAHLDESFGEVMSDLDFAGMLWLEADKGNFGVFLNALYSDMSDSARDGSLRLTVKSRFELLSGGVSYRLYQAKGLNFIPYAGFRYTLNDNQLSVNSSVVNVKLNDNHNWVDPIVGMRLLYDFNDRWSAMLAGDIGGTDASTDYSYNLLFLLGYQPQSFMKYTTWYFGYRLLDQHYQTGSGANTYIWSMKISGPLLGVAFDF